VNWQIVEQAVHGWTSDFSAKAAIALGCIVVGGLATAALWGLAMLAGLLLWRNSWRLRLIAPQLVLVAGLFFTFFAALSVFGVASPIIGAAVTFGLALGAGADIYGGLRLLFGDATFRLGDRIEIHGEGIEGWVQRVNLFETTLQLADRTKATFRNRKLADYIILNHADTPRPDPADPSAD